MLERTTLIELLNGNNTLLDNSGRGLDLFNVALNSRNAETGTLDATYTDAFNSIDTAMTIDRSVFARNAQNATGGLYELIDVIEGDSLLKSRMEEVAKSKSDNFQYLFATAGYACIAALAHNKPSSYRNLANLCKFAHKMQHPVIAHSIGAVFCAEIVAQKAKGTGYKITGLPAYYISELENALPKLSVLEYARRIQALFFREFLVKEDKKGKKSYVGISRDYNDKHISLFNKFYIAKEELEEEDLKNQIDSMVSKLDKYFANKRVWIYAYEKLATYLMEHTNH